MNLPAVRASALLVSACLVAAAAGCGGGVDPGLPDLRFIGDVAGDTQVSPDLPANPDGFTPVPDAEPPRDEVTPPPDAPPPQQFPMYAHDATTLFRIEVPSFDLTVLGSFDTLDNINDLAVTPEGRIFVISSTMLYEVDTQTGVANAVTEVAGADNVALGFLPNGELLASDKSGAVRRINPTSGAITEVGNFGHDYATAGDLVAVADGTLYGTSDAPDAYYDNNLLVKVDPVTADATPIGPIGYGQVWGMAYNGGKVYAFTRNGEIIEINPDTGQGTLKRQHDVEFWGAGVSPRVAPRG
jgi:outer membrane protein assembly factor BamB